MTVFWGAGSLNVWKQGRCLVWEGEGRRVGEFPYKNRTNCRCCMACIPNVVCYVNGMVPECKVER